MRLFVGLGNPGTKYQGNRHNIGFIALDVMARRHGFAPWRRRFQGETSEGTLEGERVVLLKPTTYMNESGRAVGEAMHFFKLMLGDISVFHDELELPPGKIRVKVGGGIAEDRDDDEGGQHQARRDQQQHRWARAACSRERSRRCVSHCARAGDCLGATENLRQRTLNGQEP